MVIKPIDVIFINRINGHRIAKQLPFYLKDHYNSDPNLLLERALKNGLIIINNSTTFALEKATKTELESILKKHDLKISGKKNDLIERLLLHVKEEEIKSIFQDSLYSLTDRGKEVVRDNKHIIISHKSGHFMSKGIPSNFNSIVDPEYTNWANDISERVVNNWLKKQSKNPEAYYYVYYKVEPSIDVSVFKGANYKSSTYNWELASKYDDNPNSAQIDSKWSKEEVKAFIMNTILFNIPYNLYRESPSTISDIKKKVALKNDKPEKPIWQGGVNWIYSFFIVLIIFVFFFVYQPKESDSGFNQIDPFPYKSQDISVYCNSCERIVGGIVLQKDLKTVYLIFDCEHLDSIIYRWYDDAWHRTYR